MSQRKTIIIGSAIALAIAIAGLAGVAHYTKGITEHGLAAERQRLAMLQHRLQESEHDAADPEPVVRAQPRQLLKGPDVVSTLQTLQRLGDVAGVVFDEQKALKSSAKGKQSYTLTGRGEPAALCALIAAIEQDPRLMILETGRFVPAGGEQVGFELGLATYHEEGGQ